MLELSINQIIQVASEWLLPATRITAFFMVIPIFGTRLVSRRIRLVLTLVVTSVMYPVLPPIPSMDVLSYESIFTVVQQFLIGFSLGFFVQLMFQVFVVAGQAVAMQNGLGFALMMDPVNGISVTSVSQLYLMIVNLLFITMNGHLVVIEVLAESFRLMPIGVYELGQIHFQKIALLGSWLFASAILIALPAIVSLLLVNVSFGVMSRVAPQMNIFAVGFPFNMVLGLFIIWLSVSGLLPQFDRLVLETLELMASFMRM